MAIRTCSYCRETGHNRTSCHYRKKHFAEFTANNIQHRKNVLYIMKELGFGIGAIIAKATDDNTINHYIVKEINWDFININAAHFTYMLDCLENPNEFSITYFPTYPFNEGGSLINIEKEELEKIFLDDSFCPIKIVNKVDEECILSTVPHDWFEGKTKKNLFMFQTKFIYEWHSSNIKKDN